MYEFIKDLSTNLFFILFLVLLYQYWSEKRDWSKRAKKAATFLLGAAGIVLCMKFSIKAEDGLFFDLRYIPFIISGLYGGPAITIGLYIVMLVVRFFLGGMVGFLLTVLIATSVAILVFAVRKRFLTWSVFEKMLFTVAFSTYNAFVVTILIVLFYPNSSMNYVFWIAYIASYLIGPWITLKIVEDIRHNELVYRKLIRNEKLEAASHLASSISHEVRNPLTASRGFMQLLSEQDVPDNCRDYIRIAIDEIDRAAGIIQDYLTFAKPSPDKIELLHTKTELKCSIDVMLPLANMNNVTIHTKIMDGIIKGERSRLQQCLVNLMKNAIEAMPNGGLLTILSSVVNNSFITIQIKDTGIGMDATQLCRLGEPYFSTKDMKGTGLGMMVVYRIIESMNGFIDVESEVGKGTCFTITLPLKSENNENVSLTKKVV
ncbi:MAG TPA: two-component sensor histidine kinase [Bacillus bacterium]|nr:two-component sensor histidine kinase [Bacillus sp. (in: firmicutes)]